MADIRYTKYGYDLYIKDLAQAVFKYYSGSPSAFRTWAWFEPLAITQGEQWWGDMIFQYKSPGPVWATVGFYLGGYPNLYSWGTLYLPATAVYVKASVGAELMTKPFIPAGITNLSELDAKWEIWLSPISLPARTTIPTDYRIGTYTHSKVYVYVALGEAEFDMSERAIYG